MNNTFQRMALIKRVLDVVKDAEAATKEALISDMEPGDRKKVAIDGAQVATISRAEIKETVTWAIENPGALIAWAKANGYEEAVVVREELADWFTTPAHLEALYRKCGIPDGVEPLVKETGGYVTVRMSADQKAALDQIIATGGVAALLAEFPQITEGAEL